MIKGLKILSVIPARGGSKGVPLKNLREIRGISIVEIAAKVSSSVDIIDKTIVSSDHEGIIKAAIKGGAEAPFIRPLELSGDRISDLEVLTHSLLQVEKDDGVNYDIVVMLQPTSPLRIKQQVIDTIEILVNNKFDSVWTVSETDSKFHPLKQLQVTNNTLKYYDEKGSDIIARQQLNKVYHRNGIAYAISRDCLVNQKSIKGRNTGFLICEGIAISVDTEDDLTKVSSLFNREES